MKKVFLFFTLGQAMALSAQQFSGNNNPVDPISRQGNVGIGMIAPPTARLQLTASASPEIRISNLATGTIPAFNWDIEATGSILNGANQYALNFTLSGLGQPQTPLALRNDAVIMTGNTVVNGAVGIGVAAPTGMTKLAVDGDVEIGNYLIGTTTPTNQAFRIMAKRGASFASSYIEMYANDGTAHKGSLHFITNSSAGNTGQYRFDTQNGNTWTTLMTINPNGSVAIGADPIVKNNELSTPSPYKLFVGGGILTQEVSVKVAEGDFPDYVFDDSYKLMSLEELDAFIEKHKHLPNMPSAQEVEKGNLNFKEIILQQQEKIEELTLYILDLQKQIKSSKSADNTTTH